MQRGQTPVYVINQNAANREDPRKVQRENIQAGKTVADVIRTCLGPRAMLKMLMDPMGGIVITNDGNAILREIMVQHPAAKSMIEIARAQDEQVGDGTTSVIVLAGEVLAVAAEFMEQKMHPVTVIGAYLKALDDCLTILDEDIAQPLDVGNRDKMLETIKGVVGTKIISKWSDMACNIALDAVRTVLRDNGGRTEIDIKNYAKVEKIPGGDINECRVMKGVMFNKDVTHPKMSRRIEKPRILLLDCPLEYVKGESKTEAEISKEEDFTRMLQLEEEYIAGLIQDIVRFKPDLVVTEKGCSDYAQQLFVENGITALRRLRKTDNNRLSRACGATIVHRTDEIKESDIGTGAGLFEVRKVGDDYFTFIEDCESPKACTVLLRGASKDILMEVERNLRDAMMATRNIFLDARMVPGGGATEMELSVRLAEKSKSIEGVQQWPYKAISQALEVIPRTLIQNCGGNTIRTLTALRAKHAEKGHQTWGVNGDTGEICDIKDLGIWESMEVKKQSLKAAVETAVMLLRIDQVVSGVKKAGMGAGPSGAAAAAQEQAMQ